MDGINYIETSQFADCIPHRGFPEKAQLSGRFQNACRAGQFALAAELKEQHLDWWSSLDEGELAYMMDLLLLVNAKSADASVKEGKREIFYLVTSNPNWSPAEDLDNLFPPLLEFEPEESHRRICSFFKVEKMEEISVGMLAEVVQLIFRRVPSDPVRAFFQIAVALPSWKKIPPFSYVKILRQALNHADYASEEEFKILFSHPSWDRLSTRDLCRLAHGLTRSGQLIQWISENKKWNELSSQELFHIAIPSCFISSEAVDLITTHPSWEKITRPELVEWASSIANNYCGDNLEFFRRVTLHPRWEEFTSQDLHEILDWLCPVSEEFQTAIHSMVLSHRSWEH